MLSCIFYEPGSKESKALIKKSRAAEQVDPSTTHNRSLSVSSSFPAARPSQHATPLIATAKDMHLISTSHSSACSSAEQWPVDTPSLGTTPPMAVRSGRSSMERRSQQQPTSLAGSPDQRSEFRSGSNFGTTMASSLSRSFTFGPSGSSSPPGNANRKKASPAGSLNTSGAAGYPAGGSFGKPASAVPDYLTASTAATSQTHSETESERQGSPEPNKSTKTTKGIKVSLKNPDMFDCDNQAHVPLLNDEQLSLAAAYRHAYAHFLFIWGMSIQRAEILGVEAIADDHDTQVNRPEGLPPPARQGRQTNGFPSVIQDAHAGHDGLGMQRHCANCGTILRPSSVRQGSERKSQKHKSTNCLQCSPAQPMTTRISCIICSEMIQGMFTPCLNCGHVTCLECHKQWFTPPWHTRKSIHNVRQNPNPDNSNEIPSCASGCGCFCAEHAMVEMSMPPSAPAVVDESSTSPTHAQAKPQGKPRRTKPLDDLRANKWLPGRHTDADGGNQDDDNDDAVKTDQPSDALPRGPGTWLAGGQSQRRRQRRTADMKQQGRNDGSTPGSASAAWGHLLERVETM